MDSGEQTKSRITSSPNGPYIVNNLEKLHNSKGEQLQTKNVIALCRCGGSANKPFCDGTHAKIGFSDGKLEGRAEDKRDDYVGAEITIHDNRGICAHAGLCTDGLPKVFLYGKEPWIDPNGATSEEIVRTIEKCPSGALSYSIEGVEHRDQNRRPEITVAKNGPYVVTGGSELAGVIRGQGASEECYTLCRCGGSKNKPFCDGTHWSIKFQDDQN